MATTSRHVKRKLTPLTALQAEVARLRRDVDTLSIMHRLEELTIRVSRLEAHEELR